ncbi:MAG: peptidoglycan-associated lipoprotein Pal [Pseudomonadota bacterium]
MKFATERCRDLSRFALRGAALSAALILAGCATTGEEVTSDAAAREAAAAAAARAANQSSVEYFQVAVGDRIFFATDRSDLTPEAQAVLRRQAEWLRQNPQVQVRIEGHADERGTREYNLALGARRAEAVTNFLSGEGVERRRLQPVSFGKERPVETCSQDACWAKNRRSVTAPL